MSVDFDLFGNPWVDAPPRRGRPPHEVTPRNRNRVSMLLACGWMPPRIAAAMGITPPTLREYYFFELRQQEVARDRLELRRLEMAWDMAEGGNVGALKEFGKLLERNDRMETERALAVSPGDTPERVGKKVAAERRAVDADASLSAELDLEATENALH